MNRLYVVFTILLFAGVSVFGQRTTQPGVRVTGSYEPGDIVTFQSSRMLTSAGVQSSVLTDAADYYPPYYYVTTGMTARVYFDGLLFYGQDESYSWNVNGSYGVQNQHEWSWSVPTNAVDHTLTFLCYDRTHNILMGSHAMSVRIAPKYIYSGAATTNTVEDASSPNYGDSVITSMKGVGYIFNHTNNFNAVNLTHLNVNSASVVSTIVVRVTDVLYPGSEDWSGVDDNATYNSAGVLAAATNVVSDANSYTNLLFNLGTTISKALITNTNDTFGIDVTAYDSSGVKVATSRVSSTLLSGKTPNQIAAEQVYNPFGTWRDYNDGYSSVEQLMILSGAETNRVLVIGDSITFGVASSLSLSKALYDLDQADDGFEMEFIGTKSNNATAASKHEGWSGATWGRFWQTYRVGNVSDGYVTNNFIASNGGNFDLQYYCTNNAFAAPSFVVVQLGVNECAAASDTNAVATAFSSAQTYIDGIHASIISYSPETKLLLAGPTLPAFSQDAAGANNGVGLSRDVQKANVIKWNQLLQSIYGNRKSDGIYVVASYLNVDTRNEFPMTEDIFIYGSVTNRVIKQSNFLHHARVGQEANAAVIYAALKYFIANPL